MPSDQNIAFKLVTAILRVNAARAKVYILHLDIDYIHAWYTRIVHLYAFSIVFT